MRRVITCGVLHTQCTEGQILAKSVKIRSGRYVVTLKRPRHASANVALSVYVYVYVCVCVCVCVCIYIYIYITSP
jgi:hypothetical protein